MRSGELVSRIVCDESEDYAYQWVKDIVFNKTGEKIAKPKKPRKANIPKALKMTIWDEFVGKDKRRALCICCCDREIELNNCVYGHIISEKDGGKANVENLLPICSQCNGSMGAQNMGEYVQQSYPKIWPTSRESNTLIRNQQQIILF